VDERLTTLEQRLDKLETLADNAANAVAQWQRSRVGRKLMAMFGGLDAGDNAHDAGGGPVRRPPVGN
jgi:hypothetical protein